MKYDVYVSAKFREKYLIVSEGTDISRISQKSCDEFDSSNYWKSIILDDDKPLIGLDPKVALDNIKKYGFYIHNMTAIKFEK